MTLEQLLKQLGFDDDQIKKVTSGMTENKMFVTDEENAKIRLADLKKKSDGKDTTIKDLEKKIETLGSANGDAGKLQQSITDKDTEIKKLQDKLEQQEVDSALKLKLIENNVDDVDYVMFKIKKSNNDLKLDDNGSIKDVDSIIKETKTILPDQFKTSNKNVQELRLENGDGDNKPKEPESLEDSLKDFFENESEN